MMMFQFAPVSDRIRRIREKKDVFTGGRYMTLNAERTKIYTDYCREHDNEFPLLRRAGALYAWCATKTANVFDDDIFVGTPGPDAQSLSPYVEWSCDWIPGVVDDTDENFKKAWQTADSIRMTDEQREIFRDAYAYWKDKTLSKLVEGALTDDFWDEAFGNGSILNGIVMYRQKMSLVSGMPQGHYVANFDKVVNAGFGAVKKEALEKIAAQKGKLFGDKAKSHLFYHAVVRVCDGAMLLSKRYAAACRQKAEAASGDRRAELLKMADSLEWIMENPARTYWEGLQAILFYELLLITDAQQHGQSMGRVDKYVGHLLEKQLKEGTITREEAQEYSDAFILRIYDYISLPGFFMNNQRLIELNEKGGNLFTSIYDGMTATAGIALTLGGSKPDGKTSDGKPSDVIDDSTAATAFLLQTYGRMHLPDPTVALRINKNTPDEIWRLGIESSKVCGGIPQLQNDGLIPKQLMDLGFTAEEAYNYSIVSCVEPAGTGNEWPACGMTGRESIWNMMDVIQLVINGGVNPRSGKTAVKCKKLYEYESFEELKAAFELEMKHVLDWTVSYSNIFEMVYSHYFPCIAASSMMEGCMESGKDVTEGRVACQTWFSLNTRH
jgi:pyruvate-formate lyase